MSGPDYDPRAALRHKRAAAVLARARASEARAATARVPIDYAAAQCEYVRQKAALTRAVNAKDRDAVILACAKAVSEWNKPARAWPDDWARWQRALDDALPFGQSVRLEDLD